MGKCAAVKMVDFVTRTNSNSIGFTEAHIRSVGKPLKHTDELCGTVYCQGPEKDEMVCCDHCNNWFHLSGMGTTAAELAPQKQWFCGCKNKKLDFR